MLFMGFLNVSKKIINATNVIKNNINILKKGIFDLDLSMVITFCVLSCSASCIILSISEGIFSLGLIFLILISFFF